MENCWGMRGIKHRDAVVDYFTRTVRFIPYIYTIHNVLQHQQDLTLLTFKNQNPIWCHVCIHAATCCMLNGKEIL